METISSLYYKYRDNRFLYILFLLFLGIILGGGVTYFSNLGLMVIGITLFLFLPFVFIQKPRVVMGIILLIYPATYLYLREFKLFPGSFYEISLSGFLNIFIVLMTVFYCFVNQGRLARKPYLLKSTLFFIVLLLPSFLFSSYRFISLRYLLRTLVPISFYVIFTSTIKNKKQLRNISNILIYSSFIPLFIGLWQIIPGSPIYHIERLVNGMRRIYGTFSHPNGFATFLTLILLFLILLYFKPETRSNKSYILLIVASLVCLFFTLTRVAWVSFACSSFILFYFLKLKRKYLMLVTFVLIILLFMPSLNRIFISRIRPDSSTLGRVTFNEYSLNKFKEKPVFGSGLGMYSIISKECLGKVSEHYGISGGYAPHNNYLGFLVETGILGLLGYLVLLFSIVKLGLNIYRRGENVKCWGVLLIAAVSAIAIIGLTDAGFEYGGIYFWSIIAIVELKYRLAGKPSSDEKYGRSIING